MLCFAGVGGSEFRPHGQHRAIAVPGGRGGVRRMEYTILEHGRSAVVVGEPQRQDHSTFGKRTVHSRLTVDDHGCSS